MRRIAILVHRSDQFVPTAYLLPSIVEMWKQDGIEIDLVRGLPEARDADLAILHVDLTVVPPEYLALAGRYPKCLNRYTADISKRAFSRQLVRPGDGYEGPVLVKANLNSGGQKEAERSASGGFSHLGRSSFKDYAVVDAVNRVPDHVWNSPDLVVERFLPEKRDGCFCLRIWYFLGAAELHLRSYSREPVIKGSNTIRREALDDVPDELREMRESLGFDFAKFDYTVTDGRVNLFDVNRTPSITGVSAQVTLERCAILAPGIHPFLAPQ